MNVWLGTCIRCQHDLYAPRDVVEWTETGVYHVECRNAVLRVRAQQHASNRVSRSDAA